jgi:zinc-binding in reverse transcriptase
MVPLGFLLVNSLYEWLKYRGISNLKYVTVWNTQFPLKIKIYLWLLKRDRALTKLNLQKRGWQGFIHYEFCTGSESSNHLFVTCSFINFISQWIARYNNFKFLALDNIQEI